MSTSRLAAAIIAAVCICCTISLGTAASAEDYSAVVNGQTLNAPTDSSWAYELVNTSIGPSYYIWQLSVIADEGVIVVNHSQPLGWTWLDENPDEPTNLATWFCTFGDGVAPGKTLSGFKVTFSGRPVTQEYTAMINNLEQPQSLVNFGQVATVPEPVCWPALAAALPCTVAFLKRRRS